jgi:hypothetical protein
MSDKKTHERFRVVTHKDGRKEVHSQHGTREDAKARITSDGLTNDDRPSIERGEEPWEASGTTSTVWVPDPECP